jgi:uncharacterized protein YneR
MPLRAKAVRWKAESLSLLTGNTVILYTRFTGKMLFADTDRRSRFCFS